MGFFLWLLFVLAILYAWGGIYYLALRKFYSDSAEDQRRFLEKHYRIFTRRIFKDDHPAATLKSIREAGSGGWSMVGLPLIHLTLEPTFVSVSLCIAMLFFGGMIFANSWYGRRCFRILGVESYVSKR